jgi:DNA repair protein RecO (recombination protein O)
VASGRATPDVLWFVSVVGAGWYGADMPDRRLYVTDAIVLSRFDFGEADRILTLLTPELGKIKAIAKGIRRPTSRIGGSLEPLAELRLQLAKGRTFDVVTQVTMQHAWLGLRDRLEVTATAWYCAELVDRSLEERHAVEPLYLLLRRAYELLDAGMAPGRVARWFEMRLCDELGVRPEVDRCVECGRLLEPDDAVRWIPLLGGVLCGRHGGPSAAAAGLSTDALKVLKAYQRLDVEALAGLRLPGAVEAEVERALGEFVRHVMERDTRSRRFLEEVRAGYGDPSPADRRPPTPEGGSQ